jgi:hypothetical protein
MSDEPTFPRSPRHGHDALPARDTRFQPCRASTWCILAEGHEAACDQHPRTAYEPPTWLHRPPHMPARKP